MLCTNQVSDEGKERESQSRCGWYEMKRRMEDAEERDHDCLTYAHARRDARRLKMELAPRDGWENQPPRKDSPELAKDKSRTTRLDTAHGNKVRATILS
jgi:hypothetical protein